MKKHKLGTTDVQLKILGHLTGKQPVEILQDAIDQLHKKTMATLTDEEWENHKKWVAEESETQESGMWSLYKSMMAVSE